MAVRALTSAAVIGTLCAGTVIAVALVGWFSYQVFRQNGRILARLDMMEAELSKTRDGRSEGPGLAVGTTAPSFLLPDLSTKLLVSLDHLMGEYRPVLLIFSDPECRPCRDMLPDVVRWESAHRTRLTIVVVSRGSDEANRSKFDQHRPRNVLLQQDREVAAAYNVPGTPAAVLIAIDGSIASSVAMGAQAIAALISMVKTEPVSAANNLTNKPAQTMDGNPRLH